MEAIYVIIRRTIDTVRGTTWENNFGYVESVEQAGHITKGLNSSLKNLQTLKHEYLFQKVKRIA